jgi:hypothetical protein
MSKDKVFRISYHLPKECTKLWSLAKKMRTKVASKCLRVVLKLLQESLVNLIPRQNLDLKELLQMKKIKRKLRKKGLRQQLLKLMVLNN